jgi:hypothetical protein
MQAAQALPAGAGGLSQTSLGALPPGVTGYSVVSTYSGGKACVRTTEYAPGKEGAPPKILTSASQGCGETAAPAKGAPAPVSTPPTPRRQAAPVTPVRWQGSPAAQQVRD